MRPGKRWTLAPGGWTRKQLALLGTDHDESIAKKIGRTRSAVTSQRVRRKIPAFSGWPGGGPAWTAEELSLLGTDSDEVIAKTINRTPSAVMQKRTALKIAVFRNHTVPKPSKCLLSHSTVSAPTGHVSTW